MLDALKAAAGHGRDTGRRRSFGAQVRVARGEPHRTVEALAGWAERQAAKRAETDPGCSTQPNDAAKAERDDVRQRHAQECRTCRSANSEPTKRVDSQPNGLGAAVRGAHAPAPAGTTTGKLNDPVARFPLTHRGDYALAP